MKHLLCKAVLTMLPFATPQYAHAAENYSTGNIINVTSTVNGVMLQLDAGTPTNCNGTPYGWMVIKQENKAMLALLMLTYASGKKLVTVYTSGLVNGYCEISQFDPVD